MIGDIVGEVAGGVLKFIGRVIFEVVFEFLIKGAGYALCRSFSRRKLDPDGGLVVVVGLAFWVAVGLQLRDKERSPNGIPVWNLAAGFRARAQRSVAQVVPLGPLHRSFAQCPAVHSAYPPFQSPVG